VMNLALDTCVADRDRLVEVGSLVQEFTVVGFVTGEVGVVC
jgi:hypothetical protein